MPQHPSLNRKKSSLNLRNSLSFSCQTLSFKADSQSPTGEGSSRAAETGEAENRVDPYNRTCSSPPLDTGPDVKRDTGGGDEHKERSGSDELSEIIQAYASRSSTSSVTSKNATELVQFWEKKAKRTDDVVSSSQTDAGNTSAPKKRSLSETWPPVALCGPSTQLVSATTATAVADKRASSCQSLLLPLVRPRRVSFDVDAVTGAIEDDQTRYEEQQRCLATADMDTRAHLTAPEHASAASNEVFAEDTARSLIRSSPRAIAFTRAPVSLLGQFSLHRQVGCSNTEKRMRNPQSLHQIGTRIHNAPTPPLGAEARHYSKYYAIQRQRTVACVRSMACASIADNTIVQPGKKIALS